MHNEIVEFVKAGKPVVFMRPGVVPERFLQADLKLPEPAVAVPACCMGAVSVAPGEQLTPHVQQGIGLSCVQAELLAQNCKAELQWRAPAGKAPNARGAAEGPWR